MCYHYVRMIPIILGQLIVLKDYFVTCEFQSFAIAPTDSEVVEGKKAILQCHVLNQAGQVQWSKDGLLLGFDPRIPGFERYSLVGNQTLGTYNLQIVNAQLEDDADYECQVGPAPDQQILSGKAHLTVLLPPTSIHILDHSNGSKIQIKYSESLTLACEVRGGKPAPEILWFRNSFSLAKDDTEQSITNEDDGRQIIKSTLRINPLPLDNKAYYSCEARSPFATLRLVAGVFLDVLYPPGRPVIEGYRSSEKIRAGETVNIRCISRGGNPLAQLVWTKDGGYVDHSYSSSEWEAINEISFVADPSDDRATYTCTASSIMTEPMVKSVTLKVLYAPSSATIKVPKEAKPGDVITATCKTEKSNPAPEITWVVDGRPFISDVSVEADAKGGWITTSKIHVNVSQQDRNQKLFTCYAVNQELGETISKSESVSILYAPDPPAIFGYTEKNAIHAGKVQRLTCISHGGNPLPELKWYKGDQELSGPAQTSSGSIVSKELTVIAAADDNDSQYHCKSTSKALKDPLIATVTFTVYFPPISLSIKVKPKKPKAGSEVRLICESDSSNPAANITWWKGGEMLGVNFIYSSATTASSNGGFSTKVTLYKNVTADDDGSTYTCRATNEVLQQSIHDAIILPVYYKPVFTISDSTVFEVKENESAIIDVTAKGNPDKIAYKWMKENVTLWEGPTLNITAAERTQSGVYTCQAVNDIGETSIAIVLKILFPAIIVKGEGEEKIIIAEPGSSVRLECAGDGYPLSENAIKWKRDDFNMQERTETVSLAKGKSILIVKNVSREVSGEFICIADNGIGNADTWKIVLLVKHEPVIKDFEAYNMVYSERGVIAQLQCKAEGVPEVSFSWSFQGAVVSQGNSRMKTEIERLDYLSWKGLLIIEDVIAKDFGEYKCIARNEIGFDTTEINFLPDGVPDPPAVIKVTNATKNSLFITWVPGFSGGHNQTHRVRFKSVTDPAATYIDVYPAATNSIWIKDLKPGVEYELALMSINIKGSSTYSTDKVKAKTLGLSDAGFGSTKDLDDLSFNGTLLELLAGTVGTVFLLLLLFNIVLLALYYKKKSPRPNRKHSEDETSRSSVISVSSKVESEETTFSAYSDESLMTSGDTSSAYKSLSIHYSDSHSYDSSEETRTDYSKNYSSDGYSVPKHPIGEFV